MKLCFNINAFAGKKFKPFPQKPIEIIAENDYKWVELRLDKPYCWLEDLNFAKIVEVKSLLKRFGLKVSQIGAETCGGYERSKNDVAPPGQRFGPSFSDEDPLRRKLRIDYTKAAIDFAVAMDTDNINTCTGYQPKTASFQKTWQRVKTGYREVAKYAQKRGVWINIEYEPGEFGPGGLFIANAKDTLKMIKDIGYPNVGVTLDIGHSVVCGEDVPEVIKMLFKEKVLRHIHIEDIKDKVHFHLVPGKGDIDFDPIFKALKEINYKDCISVELYSLWDKDPADAAKRSYEYLMKNFGQFFE